MPGQIERIHIVGIRACALGDNKVAQVQIGAVGTRGTDTDDILNIIEIEQLV